MIWLFDDDASGMEVDNDLQKSTRKCHRQGGYCTPDCALAFVSKSGKEWMCGDAIKIQSQFVEEYFYPEVRWK